MNIFVVLLIVLLVFGVGTAPVWPHSANWGYYPSAGAGLIVVILLIWLLLGR